MFFFSHKDPALLRQKSKVLLLALLCICRLKMIHLPHRRQKKNPSWSLSFFTLTIIQWRIRSVLIV